MIILFLSINIDGRWLTESRVHLARDLPFCGGNCEIVDPTLPAQVTGLFPNASKFEAVVVPGGGHALNLVRIHLNLPIEGLC